MPGLAPAGRRLERARPASCAAAIANIEPIIHGSGVRSHAHRAPPAAATASAPSTRRALLWVLSNGGVASVEGLKPL